MTSKNPRNNAFRSPRVLTTFRHPMEAEHLVNHLRENNIDALATGAVIATGAIEFAQIDVEVLVPEERLESARRVMEDLRANEPPIDWSKVDWQGDGASDEIDRTSESSDTIESTISRRESPRSDSNLGNWILAISGIAVLIWAWITFFGPN